MTKFRGYNKPEQAPLLGEDTRMTWTRPAPPAPVKAEDKVGPVPVRRQAMSRQSQDEQQWRRMWELKRRVAAGEDLETVKRELWADQYRGEADL